MVVADVFGAVLRAENETNVIVASYILAAGLPPDAAGLFYPLDTDDVQYIEPTME